MNELVLIYYVFVIVVMTKSTYIVTKVLFEVQDSKLPVSEWTVDNIVHIGPFVKQIHGVTESKATEFFNDCKVLDLSRDTIGDR